MKQGKELTLVRAKEKERPTLAVFKSLEYEGLLFAVNREGINAMFLGREVPLAGIEKEKPYQLKKIDENTYQIEGYSIQPINRGKIKIASL